MVSSVVTSPEVLLSALMFVALSRVLVSRAFALNREILAGFIFGWYQEIVLIAESLSLAL
jgi:hypothetical protein